MYITINDIVLNQGTEYEKYRPYEIFINSKNLDHYQWIVALTRVLSSVFRKGGDVAFLVEELKAVFDPKGGYFAGEGRFMPSIIAELGYVIERHFKSIGIISQEFLDEHQKELIDKKRQEFENQDKQTDAFVNQEFPHGSTLCGQCNTVAVVLMDNCETCLNCGYSKCGQIATMKMPLSEIIDRYTITLLKSERTDEDVSEELAAYKKELPDTDIAQTFVDRMYEINGKIWETEGDIRKGADMPLDEVGRLAIRVRELNQIRNGIKGEIVDEFAEGFKEIKVNYKKVDYGRSDQFL